MEIQIGAGAGGGGESQGPDMEIRNPLQKAPVEDRKCELF